MKKSLTANVGLKVITVSLILGCLPILNPGPALAQEDGPKVRLWDTGKRYRQKNPRQLVFKDRANWVQVPYGKTARRGDLMIEGETFYLFLFTNRQDGPDLLPKHGKEVGKPSEIYKVHQDSRGVRNFGYGTKWVKILKNTAEEIVVEHAGRGHIASQCIATRFRVVAGRPWLEVRPVELANQQGIYSRSRICAYVRPSGDDLIMDSLRQPYREDLKVPAPAGTIGTISFSRRYLGKGHDFMWFMTFPPGVQKHAFTHLGFSADPTAHHEEPPLSMSVPAFMGRGGTFWEDIYGRRPSMGAQYAWLGEGGVVIGVLNDPNNWTREDVWWDVKKGQTYTTRFKAPYAGEWKVAARLAREVDTSGRLNMVKDPGAEGEARTRIEGYDLPVGWGLYAPRYAEWGVTTDEAHSGKRSVYMKITSNRGGSRRFGSAVCLGPTAGTTGERSFDAKPNTTYFFSFWMKRSKGCTKGLNIAPHGWSEPTDKRASLHMFLSGVDTCSFMNAGANVPAGKHPYEVWQWYEGWFTTGPNTRKIVLFLEIYGTPAQVPIGTTFWVDDVFLGPMVVKKPARYVHSRVKVESGQPFTFRSPSDGKLDYVLMYLWDRTARTPKSVQTPMDVYRQAIQDKKQ